MSSFPSFVRSQLFHTPPYPTHSFAGQTVVVTGANSGLGLEAARLYVRQGASTVIITSRSAAKGEAAKRDIEATENRPGVVQVWDLDLSSFASVRAFAKRCETLPRLDIVVENAGICQGTLARFEGHEAHVTINVISTFFLLLLLLPTLRARAARNNGAKPVLTINTSETHHWAKLPAQKDPRGIFKTLDDEKTTDMGARYYESKLLQILVLRHLTRHVIKNRFRYPVVINCVTPGLCKTALIKDMGVAPVIMSALLGRRVDVGARTLVNATYLCGDESAGEYIADDRIGSPSPLVRSKEGEVLARRVWDELVALLEEMEPGILRKVDEGK